MWRSIGTVPLSPSQRGWVASAGTSEADASVPADLTECWEANPDCAVSSTALGLVSIMVFFCLGYFFLYCYFIHKALKQLQTKSSVEFKIANVVVRLQVRPSLPPPTFLPALMAQRGSCMRLRASETANEHPGLPLCPGGWH